MLNRKLIQEIVQDTNHKDQKSVLSALQDGDIEIYDNKEDYIEDGFSLEHKDYYTILSNGQVAHYIQ